MLFDEEMMLLAAEEARIAAKMGEVPVGAVITDPQGEVIARGHNLREASQDPTAHAEIEAIREAAKKLGSRRLTGCTIYVTLEPCPMCAGAIMNAGLKRLVYGAFDESMGACASAMCMFEHRLPYKPLVRSRVLEKECAALMTEFFKDLRTGEDQ